MIGIYLLTAASLVAVGVAIGVVAIISLGIHREEREGSLMNHTTDRVLRGARRATGVYAHVPDSAAVRKLHKGTAVAKNSR
jgi:hypothetical protein